MMTRLLLVTLLVLPVGRAAAYEFLGYHWDAHPCPGADCDPQLAWVTHTPNCGQVSNTQDSLMRTYEKIETVHAYNGWWLPFGTSHFTMVLAFDASSGRCGNLGNGMLTWYTSYTDPSNGIGWTHPPGRDGLFQEHDDGRTTDHAVATLIEVRRAFGLYPGEYSDPEHEARLAEQEESRWSPEHTPPAPITVEDCLKPYMTRRKVVMHEVGHAYGLAHNQAVPNIMNDGLTGGKNMGTVCTIPDVWGNISHQPDGDSIQGLLALYGNSAASKLNYSGTPHLGVGGSSIIDYVTDEAADVIRCNLPFSVPTARWRRNVTFTLYHSFGEDPHSVRLTGILVPSGELPRVDRRLGPNYITNPTEPEVEGGPWLDDAEGVYRHARDFSFPFDMAQSSLAVNVTYRAWILIDRLNELVEVSRTDNAIPLDVTVRRVGCSFFLP